MSAQPSRGWIMTNLASSQQRNWMTYSCCTVYLFSATQCSLWSRGLRLKVVEWCTKIYGASLKVFYLINRSQFSMGLYCNRTWNDVTKWSKLKWNHERSECFHCKVWIIFDVISCSITVQSHRKLTLICFLP